MRLTLFSLIVGFCIVALLGEQRISSTAGGAAGKSASKQAAPSPTPPSADQNDRYPYRSAAFTELVAESCGFLKAGDPPRFYAWMDSAYIRSHHRFPGKESLSLQQLLKAEKQELALITDKSQKTRAETSLCAWVHRMIKTTIPRFSLDRGFEFVNVVRFGERHCFLQSVLIASLLQEMGLDAGVVMVYKNIQGAQTNNGHAVVLVKLPDGKDIMVDASQPEAFPRHRGLMVRCSSFRYLDPAFEPYSDKISHYVSADGRKTVGAAQVRTLDIAFLHSQFWYYRGERAKGGILAKDKTGTGMASTIYCLEKSVKLCPSNPLSVYMLARAYSITGDSQQAGRLSRAAYRLYSTFGWVPAGARRPQAGG